MRKIIYAMTALMTLTLWSCSNEDIAGTDGFEKGEKSSLSLTIKMPATANTRAVPGGALVGTAEESTLSTIGVFVFETNGTLAATDNATGYYPLTVTVTDPPAASDNFTRTLDGSGNYVYKLKPENAISTLSGAKHIYVIGNPPATVASKTTENDLLAAIEDVANMDNSNGFTMVSDISDVNKTLNEASPATATDGSQDDNLNVFESTLTRVVAKVVASSLSKTYTKDWTATGTEPAYPLQLVYNIRHFRVIQGANTSYVTPNFWEAATGGLQKTYPGIAPTAIVDINEATEVEPFNFFSVDAAAAPVAIRETHPATDAEISAMAGVYVGENYPVGTDKAANALKGNTTYVYVSTTVTANASAYWVHEDANSNGTIEAGEGYVAWHDFSDTPYGNTHPTDSLDTSNTDIYVIHTSDGKDYVSNEADRNNLALGLGINPDPANNAAGVGIFTYPKGWVHFQVWLNKNGMNDYSVLRNEFIHVKISDIVGSNYLFPGYPGDLTHPEQPEPPTDPKGPKPELPEEEVDGLPAYLTIEVTVNPWIYKPNENVVLQ